MQFEAIDSGGPASRAGTAIQRWWAGEGGAWGRALDVALVPAELAYHAVMAVRTRAYLTGLARSHRARVPVVSVGNIAVGGTGKTPVVRWVVGRLRERGLQAAVLHGGYSADEPMLHRTWNPDVPVLAQGDRVAAARRAIEGGATVLVLDDGYQHLRLSRDLDIVLLDAERWSATPRLLPRGAWREPPRELRRADVVAVTRRAASEAAALQVLEEARAFAPHAAWLRIHLRPAGWRRPGLGIVPAQPQGQTVAVCGVARPDDFVANAREAGAAVAAVLVFRDHHGYGPADVERIRAKAAGRPVVTTAKDAVKLATLAGGLELWILEQEVIVEAGHDAVCAMLDRLGP